MLATIIGNRVYVTISRRNLRQLNAILDQPNGRNKCLTRKDESGVSLVLQVEDDADHYKGRDPRPGVGQGCVMSRAVSQHGPSPQREAAV